MLNELRTLNNHLARYSMLNKLGIKLEGKSIGLKKAPGIMGVRLFPSQRLHFRGSTLVLFQIRWGTLHYLHIRWGWPRCLPTESMPYLDHALSTWWQNSLAKHPQGPVGSVWVFWPDQISREGTRLYHWCVDPEAWGMFRECLRLGCVCRLVPLLVHEAPHNAGGPVEGLWWR